MTAVEAAIVEIADKLAQFAPEHEGLRDFTRLDLKPETQAEVAASLANYDRRVGLLETAKAACEALMADGHPDLPVREIPASAFEDIAANHNTVMAAYARFSPAPEAATITVVPGQPEDK